MTDKNKKEIVASFDYKIDLLDASKSVMMWEGVMSGEDSKGHKLEVGVGVMGRGGVVYVLIVDGKWIAYLDVYDLLQRGLDYAVEIFEKRESTPSKRKAVEEKKSALGKKKIDNETISE